MAEFECRMLIRNQNIGRMVFGKKREGRRRRFDLGERCRREERSFGFEKRALRRGKKHFSLPSRRGFFQEDLFRRNLQSGGKLG